MSTRQQRYNDTTLKLLQWNLGKSQALTLKQTIAVGQYSNTLHLFKILNQNISLNRCKKTDLKQDGFNLKQNLILLAKINFNKTESIKETMKYNVWL